MKAQVAAAFVMKRVPGVNIIPHTRRLETFDSNFYRSFSVVIAGLDNVESRRWLNSMLCSLVKMTEDGPDPSSVIPFIDGGTEAFRGQSRLFLPQLSSCYECSIASLPEQKGFARCTLANIPRIPEHCIAYAREKQWALLVKFRNAADYELYAPTHKMDQFEPQAVRFDADDPDHMSWVFHRACERAAQFSISGVTYSLTMQVVKNIIPAIASTNALISAICVHEAVKAITFCSMSLNNFYMYMGDSGVYARTFEYERNPACIVCGVPAHIDIDKTATLEQLIFKIVHETALKVKTPSLSVQGRAIYLASKAVVENYKENLSLSLQELFDDGNEVIITDSAILGKTNVKLRVHFVDGVFPLPKADE